MPEISRFFGIIIRMFLSDHALPHFHAYYQDADVVIVIESGEIVRGSLPRKQLYLVMAWLEIHREEMLENWQVASTRSGEIKKIKPLS